MTVELFSSQIASFKKEGNILISPKQNTISYPEEDNQTCFEIEENSFWFEHRNNCVLEVVKKYYAGNTPFVDVGGGNGFTSSHLEKSGIKTLLIEPGINGCINAQKRGLKNIVCSTLETAPLKENSVSAMGFFDVVEHIEKDHLFLIHAKRYLARNGYIFITVPAYEFLWSKEDEDSGHYRRYTLKKLRNLLRISGYSVEYSTYIFSLLTVPIFFRRTLPSILGLNENSHDAKKLYNEHQGKSVLGNLWNMELNHIRKGKKIPFGSSCLVVAKVTI